MDVKNIRYVTINRSCHVPQEFRFDDWNCNHCANDNEYYQPFIEGDFIFLQTWFEDKLSTDPTYPDYGWYTHHNGAWYIRIRMYALDGSLISDEPNDFVNMSCCGSVDNLSFQNIRISTNGIIESSNIDCFYFEYEVKTSSNTSEIYRTESFKRVVCEETFTMQGNFSGFDSQCKYYDLLEDSAYYDFNSGTDFFNFPCVHVDKYRVLGTYEHTGTANDCVMLEDGTMSQVKASTLRRNVYRLRTLGLPPYVAEMMCNSTTGYSFIIDDCIECLCHAGFQKNNETGLMWYIDTEIQQIAAQVNHNNCE
jgi:hypothetical protein